MVHLSAPIAVPAQQPAPIAADRARLAEIVGAPGAFGTRETRRDSTLRHGPEIDVLPPSIRSTWNSDIPFSLGDGALWEGRGHNLAASGGVRARQLWGTLSVSVVVAPLLTYSQNRPYQIRPDSFSGRSAFASRFHNPPSSADLPVRFGDRSLARIDPGASGVAVEYRAVRAGFTAATDIWGPGLRNQLVMSGNAAGIPRLFVESARPLSTRLGTIASTLFAGALTESGFFDVDVGNDLRSISGWVLELTPAFDSSLTLGFERVVYRPIGRYAGPVGAILKHALDAPLHWEFPRDSVIPRADQITGIYARWISKEAGFEVFTELARSELPTSPHDFATGFHHSLGYTVGFQWAQPRRADAFLRLQAEFTDLEQSRVFVRGPAGDFYSGQATEHGYTQRGQVIGAAIGPGASSQWLAVDQIAPSWQLGAFVGRIRWENDAMYRETFPQLFGHDVTVYGGLRGARRTRWTDVSVDATFGYRFNYLFQNGIPQPGGFGFRTVDVRNVTLTVGIAPRS
jgi:hypothetical protein